MNNNNTILDNLSNLKNCLFLEKNDVFYLTNKLKSFLWIEFFQSFLKNYKKKKEETFSRILNHTKFHEFLDVISLKNNFFFFRKKKKNNFHLKTEIFLLICIDEFINGRKEGFKFSKSKFSWNRNSWKFFEKTIEKITKDLKKSEKVVGLLFLLFETLKYENIKKIFIQKKNTENNLRFFLKSKNFFFTRKHKEYTNFILTVLFMKLYLFKKTNLNFDFLFNFFKNLLNAIFFRKKKMIQFFFSLIIDFTVFDSIDLVRYLFDGFSENAILNKNFFWPKLSMQSLFNLLREILGKKTKKDLIDFKKKSIILLNFGFNFAKNFIFNLLQEMEVIETITKTAVIFGAGILSLNSNDHFFLLEILSKFEKINPWTEFLIGNSFLLISFRNQKLYRTLLSITKKNFVSESLKGGILFGFGMTFKDFPELEKRFLRYLKQNITFHGFFTKRFGAGMGMGLCLINKIKDPVKSRLVRFMIVLALGDYHTGEAGCFSLGLMFLGTPSVYLLKEFFFCIEKAENENIIKSLVLSMALVFYKNKEESDVFFHNFIEEKDPMIRYCAVCLYTLAYVKTRNFRISNKFIKILVTDPDDNVKKASVIGLGFLFYSRFDLLEKIINPLIVHYNPFVRYGACFAIGISSINNANYKTYEFLERLTKDNVDFVRQGAFLSIGIAFFGNKNLQKKFKIKELFRKKLNDPEESNIGKFGIILGICFLESIQNKNKDYFKIEKRNLNQIVGLFLFIQHWFWIHFLGFFFF